MKHETNETERLGATIRAAREKLPMSRRSLRKTAARVGISNMYLSEIERDKKVPSIAILVAIAREVRISSRKLRALAGVAREGK